MKIYVLSLSTGLLVGLLYSLLQVRSPAPPLVALIGLLGMLAGEEVIPLGKQLLLKTGFGSVYSINRQQTARAQAQRLARRVDQAKPFDDNA